MSACRSLCGYFIATALVLSASCGGAPSGPDDGAPPARLDALPRALSASETKVVDAANEFSFSLFRAVAPLRPDSNVFISPLSASFALGMTMNGAAGATYDQMRSVLAFGSATESDINGGYKSLIELLRGLDPQVDFRIANSIWYHVGLPVKQPFLDATRTSFGAEVSALDFRSADAPGKINDWVSSATAGKIPTILDRIDPAGVMILINAIYFKGSWRDRFDPASTQDAPFHGVAGDQPMRLMHRDGTMRILATPDFEAVDLPYGNSAFTMTVVLPRPGKSIETLASSLQSAQWSTWMGQLGEANVDLYLPRFKLTWERTLNDDLRVLGMRDAFEDNVADFTRISSAGNRMFITEVKQKTYVDVNEEGTEAAAATSVGISVDSAPAIHLVRVDRPFLFVIRERLSGTVFFMGKIVRMP
jgi:serine protease inhibitor